MGKALDFYLQMKEMVARDNEFGKKELLSKNRKILTDKHERMLWEYMNIATLPSSRKTPIDEVIKDIDLEPFYLDREDSDALFLLKLEWVKCTLICHINDMSWADKKEYIKELARYEEQDSSLERKLIASEIIYEIFEKHELPKHVVTSSLCLLYYVLSELDGKSLDKYGVRMLYVFYDFLCAFIDSENSKDELFIADRIGLLRLFCSLKDLPDKITSFFIDRFRLLNSSQFIDDMLHTIEVAAYPARGTWAEYLIMEAYYDYLECLSDVSRASKDEIIRDLYISTKKTKCIYPEVRYAERLIKTQLNRKESEALASKKKFSTSIRWYLKKIIAERFADKALYDRAVKRAEQLFEKDSEDFFASRTAAAGNKLFCSGEAGIYIKLMTVL